MVVAPGATGLELHGIFEFGDGATVFTFLEEPLAGAQPVFKGLRR
jgi:hypothetical protein